MGESSPNSLLDPRPPSSELLLVLGDALLLLLTSSAIEAETADAVEASSSM
jgi:hypothetical protein